MFVVMDGDGVEEAVSELLAVSLTRRLACFAAYYLRTSNLGFLLLSPSTHLCLNCGRDFRSRIVRIKGTGEGILA